MVQYGDVFRQLLEVTRENAPTGASGTLFNPIWDEVATYLDNDTQGEENEQPNTVTFLNAYEQIRDQFRERFLNPTGAAGDVSLTNIIPMGTILVDTHPWVEGMTTLTETDIPSPPESYAIPETSSSSRRTSPRKCFVCQESPVNPARKHKICADCLVYAFRDANILNRRGDYYQNVEDNGRKKCEYCLEDHINRNRQTAVCIDCMVSSLVVKGILKKKNTLRKLLVRKVNPEGFDDDTVFLPVQRHDNRRQKPCDICEKRIIHSNRQNKVCLDCVVDAVLKKEIIEIEEEESYEIPE